MIGNATSEANMNAERVVLGNMISRSYVENSHHKSK